VGFVVNKVTKAFFSKYFGCPSELLYHYPLYYLIYYQHYIYLAMDSVV